MAKRKNRNKRQNQKTQKQIVRPNAPKIPREDILKPHNSTNNPSIELRQESHYSGFIPPPHMLREFEEILPGCAERMLSLVEQQQSHRHSQESKVVDSGINREARGQWLGFIVAMSVVTGSFLMIGLGFQVSGFGTLLTGLASLVGVFVYGKIQNNKELVEKRDAIQKKK